MSLKIKHGGGMFGQNNTQTPSNNPVPTDMAQPTPANPFADNDAPVPPADPATAPNDSPIPPPPPTEPATPAPAIPTDDNLIDIKQQAVQSLQPLVSHLDQSPEEKFKTTMMLIQATDNSSLVKQAYEAANQIQDEKARAQALLDVVNEINYFTHKGTGEPETKA
jgi:hypothetical protein